MYFEEGVLFELPNAFMYWWESTRDGLSRLHYVAFGDTMGERKIKLGRCQDPS